MLAFSGWRDADVLRRTLNSGEAAREPGTDSEEKQRCRRLHRGKAEAKARYNEGRRFTRKRGMEGLDGASQPASSGTGGASQPASSGPSSDQTAVICTATQLDVLQEWGAGMLRHNLIKAFKVLGGAWPPGAPERHLRGHWWQHRRWAPVGHR